MRDELKQEKAVAIRVYRVPQKETRQLYRRCFWTWPWGHVWIADGISPKGIPLSKCAVCEKPGTNRHG